MLGESFFVTVVDVNLASSSVTDAALEHLKRLTKLKTLHLVGTNITDAGLEHLEGLTQLKALSLDHTRVTDEGEERLRQALPECKIGR